MWGGPGVQVWWALCAQAGGDPGMVKARGPRSGGEAGGSGARRERTFEGTFCGACVISARSTGSSRVDEQSDPPGTFLKSGDIDRFFVTIMRREWDRRESSSHTTGQSANTGDL